VGEVHGPVAGLAALETLDERLPGHHRLDAVRGHLLEQDGDRVSAREHYLRAADHTTSTAEREHLLKRAAHLRPGP
jgi:predicted RNA polymerase sigma factor